MVELKDGRKIYTLKSVTVEHGEDCRIYKVGEVFNGKEITKITVSKTAPKPKRKWNELCVWHNDDILTSIKMYPPVLKEIEPEFKVGDVVNQKDVKSYIMDVSKIDGENITCSYTLTKETGESKEYFREVHVNNLKFSYRDWFEVY